VAEFSQSFDIAQLSVITLSVGESFGLRRFSKSTPLPECFGYRMSMNPTTHSK
jgi:hypothetical protein